MESGKILACLMSLCVCLGCNQTGKLPTDIPKEDHTAKKLLQGIWLNEEDENVALRVERDTIYYPDSVSRPVYFQIIADSLVLYGSQVVKYPVIKQSEHVFQFENQYGEVVRLVKSEDANDSLVFVGHRQVAVLNQNKLIRRDTVIVYDNVRYHSYVQVNPTTYKVFKPSYNEDGVAVDNVYYDNIVNVNLYRGAEKVYSSDFRKADFHDYVQQEYLSQSILSDIDYDRIDAEGAHYYAEICIPDSPTSYRVEIVISLNGNKTMRKL